MYDLCALVWPMLHPSNKYQENWVSSVSMILLTDRQKTNSDSNKTFLVKAVRRLVAMLYKLVLFCCIDLNRLLMTSHSTFSRDCLKCMLWWVWKQISPWLSFKTYHISIDGLLEGRSERTTQVDSLIQLAKADQPSEVKSVRSYLLSSDFFTDFLSF